jgi:hypothetical protein
MKHVISPMETTWYYVDAYDNYFPYIEHRPNGILLDGSRLCGRSFVVPFDGCRLATYEEVREFYNK